MSGDDPWRDTLTALLHEAGEIAMRSFRSARATLKPDGSQVSDADVRVERHLVARLARAFPGFAVVSEEGTAVDGDLGTWHVDPIDGTSAYLEGLAYWGPTVCLVKDGRLEVGALWLPRLGELWYARRGGGAWRDDERLAPADPGAPGRHHSVFLPSRFHRQAPSGWPGKVRALGSSAAHLALVAGGAGPATLVPEWKLWDVGCGVLLVQEAGRAVVDLQGQALDVLSARVGLPFLAGAPTALSLLTDPGLGGRTAR